MRQRSTLILALSLIASSVFVPAALAKDSNHVEYYENYLESGTWTCEKYDTEMGPEWMANDSYGLVVLKSSGDNDEFTNVAADTMVGTKSGKDISHIIVCGAGGNVDEDPGYDG